MKIDYNETIGIGCDGAESPGEALRKNMEATVLFIEKVKKRFRELYWKTVRPEDTGWSRK